MLPSHYSRTIALLLTLPTTYAWPSMPSLSPWLEWSRRSEPPSKLQKRANQTVWISSDVYQGETFFDGFDFWNYSDPTHGNVQYVAREAAMGNLAFVTPDGVAHMKVDNKTWLSEDQVTSVGRPSVRIHSKKKYNGGLFLLDVAKAPWGCGTWPAYWTSGVNWPGDGEIDIIENVHTSNSNQVAWHTLPGCILTTPGNFTGTAGAVTCDASINYNTGCGIVDQSIASFGQTFNEKGGGVYAMKWDEHSIDVWFFYRSAIPNDILDGLPNPANWRLPSASLSRLGCPMENYFKDQMIIFDTTLCGDWAGTSYATTGCPGTCTERVMNPANFINATWSINYVKIYEKTVIDDSFLSGGLSLQSFTTLPLAGVVAFTVLCLFVSGY